MTDNQPNDQQTDDTEQLESQQNTHQCTEILGNELCGSPADNRITTPHQDGSHTEDYRCEDHTDNSMGLIEPLSRMSDDCNRQPGADRSKEIDDIRSVQADTKQEGN